MVKIEIDLEKDKDFVDQVKSNVTRMVTSMLYHDEDKKTNDIAMHAIAEYFNRKHGSIEKFVTGVITDLISDALGDKSTMPNAEKTKNVIVTLLKQSIDSIVREKLKNVKITGIE